MLQIKNIFKTYKTGDLVQKALNDVSLNFRDNEFVAILGPSGSGKTTLLNIIGGLDRYDDGDLIINGVSTKNYKDRDFDAYRNHSIGFVFQSYNLIPHQSILSNVELALTIGGIKAQERRRRAIDALEAVGLKEQMHKKPNQMSGGQMQRVAIARALVNNPEIVLADEPTGALDTKTSMQVMELLKEVAKDRLVIMVTHNRELADKYANRIVRLKDGQIISDSNPYTIDEEINDNPKKKLKAHMSFFTALSLSFNNLLTKKGRTILTAFAGSIGIIGIALILSLSQGFQNYIDKIQEDTLSSYPLTITKESTDMTSMILAMTSNDSTGEADGTLTERQYLTNMFASVSMNEMKSFKTHVDEHQNELNAFVSNIDYNYSVSPLIYTIDTTNTLIQVNPNGVLSSFTSSSVSSIMASSYSSYGLGVFSEMSDNEEMVKNNYEVLKGRWPESYDELIIVLSEKDGISDLLVYSLGLRDFNELSNMFTTHLSGEEINNDNEPLTFTYDDLLNLDLRLIKSSNLYKYNDKYSIYEDMSDDSDYMHKQYDKALKLKIVGIVIAKDSSSTSLLSPGVNYTSDLTSYIIDEASKSDIVKKQLANKDIDVFSGKSFDEKNSETSNSLNFEEMISIDENKLSQAFKINIDLSSLNDTDATQNKIINKSKEIANDLENNSNQIYAELLSSFSLTAKTVINNYANYFSFSIPDINNSNACPLGYKDSNPMNGCVLPSESDDEYSKYKEVKGFSLNPNNPNTIYVYEGAYLEYVIFNDYFVNAYKNMAISQDILQLEELVYSTNKAFDKFVSKAKENVDTSNPLLSAYGVVKKSDVDSIDVDNLVSDILLENDIQESIKTLATNTSKEYAYLLIAKGIGEISGDLLSPLTSLGNKDMMSVDASKFADAFNFNMSQDELKRIMNAMMSNDNISSLATNLNKLSYQDKEEPSSIAFYFDSFENKEKFTDWLKNYNESVEEEKQINYTDITGILMSSVKTIVDSVTYVLIAFVSISLIVSSIMISVITLISVMERTKEIGILRAMGASKRNISSIFNAETFIIGLLSGLIGVGTTLLLIVPINKLIHALADNNNINAVLPLKYAIILVIISIFLTIFAGLLPAKKAAKKDPVIALRTE